MFEIRNHRASPITLLTGHVIAPLDTLVVDAATLQHPDNVPYLAGLVASRRVTVRPALVQISLKALHSARKPALIKIAEDLGIDSSGTTRALRKRLVEALFGEDPA